MPNTTTLAMILFLAAAASAEVISADADAIVPEGHVAAEGEFVETAVSTSVDMKRVSPTDIQEFDSKLKTADAAIDRVMAQAKKETAEAIAQRKKSEWDAARYKANTRTTLRTFPINEFPVLVETTFSQCVYKPDGYGSALTKPPPAAATAQQKYAHHYKTLCAGEIAMKTEQKESKEKSAELKDKKCADTVEKSKKSAEHTTKSFKKTQVNEAKTKKEAKAVEELKEKLQEAKEENKKIKVPNTPAPESPELCEKQGLAKEKYDKHAEKLHKADEVTEKSKSAKESAQKAYEVSSKNEHKYKEIEKKKSVESANKKSEKDEKCAKKVDVKEATEKGAERGTKGDVKEELEKAKLKEVKSKDEAESHGKEKAQKSAEAVSKTALYEK